jgi:hypothetical protein
VRIDTSSKRMIIAVTISDKRVLETMNRLIHRSAWKLNSANFAPTEFCEVCFQRAKSYTDAPSLSGHRETVFPSVLRGAGIHCMVRS